jgi:hypothetical protein
MPPVLRDYRDFDVEIRRSRRAPKVLFFVLLFSAAAATVVLRDRFPAEIREHIPAVDVERAHEMAWNAKVWVIARVNEWRGISASTSTQPPASAPAGNGGAASAGPAPAIAVQPGGTGNAVAAGPGSSTKQGPPPEVSVQALPQALPVTSTLKANKPVAPRAFDVPPAPATAVVEAPRAASSPAAHPVEASRAAAPGWHRIHEDTADDPSENATAPAAEAPRAAAPGWHRIHEDTADDPSNNAAADKGSTDDTSADTQTAPPPAKLVAAPPPAPGSLDDLIRKEVEKEQAAKH